MTRRTETEALARVAELEAAIDRDGHTVFNRLLRTPSEGDCGHLLTSKLCGPCKRIAELEAALRKYGRHGKATPGAFAGRCSGHYRDNPGDECGCNAGGWHGETCGLHPGNRDRCTCGLDAALAGEKP